MLPLAVDLDDASMFVKGRSWLQAGCRARLGRVSARAREVTET
jgi:hypothetical protein